MADITIAHPHGLSLDEAKTKTEQIVTDVRAEFPSLIDSIDWNPEKTRATVKGKAFSGTFNVDDANMSIDIALKMLARPFKGKVEQKSRERIDQYFA